MTLDLILPAEPDPTVWVNDEERSLLREQLGKCENLLTEAGVLRVVLKHWVKKRIALDPLIEFDEKAVKDLEDEWLKNNSLEKSGMSISQVRDKINVSWSCLQWSRQVWNTRIESLYLENKSQLDKVEYSLIRHHDKHLMLEIYHQIKASEITFADASFKYGQGPEKMRGGQTPLRPLSELPIQLANLLVSISPGVVTLPFAVQGGYCLACLEKYIPFVLDKEGKDYILGQLFSLWVDKVFNLHIDDVE